MGKHFNPGNEAFAEVLNSYYVDKTGVIEIINRTINTKNKLSCISRPRRFGKSYTAQTLIAYYDCSCDSHELFDKCMIKDDVTYEEHINKYNVISFDVTGFISVVKQSAGKMNLSEVPNMISDATLRCGGSLYDRYSSD